MVYRKRGCPTLKTKKGVGVFRYMGVTKNWGNSRGPQRWSWYNAGEGKRLRPVLDLVIARAIADKGEHQERPLVNASTHPRVGGVWGEYN